MYEPPEAPLKKKIPAYLDYLQSVENDVQVLACVHIKDGVPIIAMFASSLPEESAVNIRSLLAGVAGELKSALETGSGPEYPRYIQRRPQFDPDIHDSFAFHFYGDIKPKVERRK